MTVENICLSSISVDNDFIYRCKKMGIETFADVMKFKLHVLRKKREFNYTWYLTMLGLLKKYNLMGEFLRKQIN